MDERSQYLASGRPLPGAEDHRLRGDIARALKATGRFGHNRVDISASNGVVKLRGRVRSYYHKQVAQAVATSVLGDCQLVNEIEVV